MAGMKTPQKPSAKKPRRVVVMLPDEMARKVKALAAIRGTTMTQVFFALIEKELATASFRSAPG